MKLVKNLIIRGVVILLIMTACNSRQTKIKQEIPIVNIKPQSNDFFEWKSLTDSIECIKLETSENSFLGNISKSIVYHDKLYILDSRNNIFLAFNLHGEYVKKLKKGKGTGEILEVRDFCICDKLLYVLDYQRIHIFDTKTLEYIETFKIPSKKGLNSDDLAVLTHELYYLWNTDPDGYDLNENKFHYLYEIKRNKVNSSYMKFHFQTYTGNRFTTLPQSNGYLLRPPFWDNIIHRIDSNGIMPYFALDFGAKTPTKELYKKEYTKHENPSKLQLNFFKKISDIYVHNNYIYFNVVGNKGKLYQGIINSENWSILTFGKFQPGTPFVFFSDNEWVYASMNTSVALDAKYSQSVFSIAAKKQIKDIRIEDNPIIFRFKIKER